MRSSLRRSACAVSSSFDRCSQLCSRANDRHGRSLLAESPMYPTSQVAVPIFSGLWNLELLGQIHRSDFSIGAPIPDGWQAQRDSDFRDVQRLLTSGFAFDDDVSATVIEGWGTGSGWPEDERELDLYISVCGAG